jgi:secreted trypsin-like serine protease
LLLAFLVISNVAAQRGTDNEESNKRIINGQDADLGEYPFMVRISFFDD